MARTVQSKQQDGKARADATTKKPMAGKMPRSSQGGKAPALIKEQAQKLLKARGKKIDRLNAKPAGGSERTKRRAKPGARAVKEIKKLQLSSAPAIKRTPFARLSKEIVNEHSPEAYRVSAEAIDALRESAEAFLCFFLTQANRASMFGRRRVLMARDIHFTRQSFKDHNVSVMHDGPRQSEQFYQGRGVFLKQCVGIEQQKEYEAQRKMLNAVKKASRKPRVKKAVVADEPAADEAADEPEDAPEEFPEADDEELAAATVDDEADEE